MSKFTGFLSDIASIIHKATIPFTFLLAIYSLLTIINQFHKPNPEISVAVASIDQITSLPQVTDLRAEFKFKGRLVRDLWRVRLRTCNSGKSTIIGEGDHKNLIHDSLPIHIDKSFDLIGFEIEQKDFQLAVSKFEPNAIQFKFLQWKTNEAFSTLLFLERKSSDRKITPEIFKCERELEKGDIIIIDASNPKNLNRKPILDKWVSAWWARGIRFALYCFSVIIVLFGILVLVVIFSSYSNENKEYKWRVKFGKAAEKFLQENLSQAEFEMVSQGNTFGVDVKRINSMWTKFKGEAPNSIKWLSKIEEPTPKTTLILGMAMSLTILAIGVFNFAAIWSR